MNFYTNGDRFLLQKEEDETKSEGGFIMPSSEKGEVSTAKVIQNGIRVNERVNQTAYYLERDAIKLSILGKTYYIIDEEKVLGFLKEEDNG